VATSPRRMRSVTNFSPPLIVSSGCIRHSTNQEQSRKAALNDMYPQRGQSLHQLAQSSRLLMPFWPTGRLPLSCVKQPDRPPFVKLQAPTIGLLPETISFRNESIIVVLSCHPSARVLGKRNLRKGQLNHGTIGPISP
jgi:hypothetical protein